MSVPAGLGPDAAPRRGGINLRALANLRQSSVSIPLTLRAAPMKTAFIFFLLGAIAGGYAIHVYDQKESGPDGYVGVQSSGGTVRAEVADKIQQWHLTPDDIRNDLARTGEVVRENAHVAGDKISDARIVTVIKAKYVLDRDLSAPDIHVDVVDGHVTLSGTVGSADLIGKAVMLALDTSGVENVSAKLVVAPKAP
jgi:hypothetical protein